MKARYVQKGGSIDYTPASAVAAGDVVVIGKLVGVASHPIAAGATGSLAVDGVFEVVKDAAAITAGAAVYWTGTAATASADNGKTDSTKVEYDRMGLAVAAAGAADAVVRVKLG